MKKVIVTLIAALLLTIGTVSAASAGGIMDLIKSAASTAVSTVKTIGNAAIGAGKYVFTDADGEECFADAKKSANDISDGFSKMGDSLAKTGQDMMNFQISIVETTVGAVGTVATAAVETVANVVTGSDDYTWTSTAASIAKDGYDRYDSSFETAVMDVAPLVGGPVGTAVSNGVKIVKTAGEAVVGYKDRDWGDVGKAVEEGVINTAIAGATGGIGSLAEGISATTGAVTSMATKATLKTVYDLADPNNERGVVDTIVEDVTNTVVTSTVVGVLK